MLLAVAGVRLDDSPETRSSLLAALAKHPELIASTQMTGSPIVYFDVSPDGRTVATYDTTNHVQALRDCHRRAVGELQAGSTRRLNWQSGKVQFSPDGHALAITMAAPSRQPVVLLDATRWNRSPPSQVDSTSRWQLLGLKYSGDGRRLATTL